MDLSAEICLPEHALEPQKWHSMHQPWVLVLVYRVFQIDLSFHKLGNLFPKPISFYT